MKINPPRESAARFAPEHQGDQNGGEGNRGYGRSR